MPSYDVVITGVGLITPLGITRDETWSNAQRGVSGVGPVTQFDASCHSSQVAGEVRGMERRVRECITPNVERKTSRFIQLALIAAHEALTDAGFTQETVPYQDAFGVYVGVGIGGLDIITQAATLYEKRGIRAISPFMLPKALINEASGWISMEWGLQGPQLGICNACASGTDAIGFALHAIRSGRARAMVAGGAESCLTPIAFAAFSNMRALSTWKGDPKRASRPFDKERNGFVMGEGAGFFVLERKEDAKARGARIYGEVAGYGSSSDAYHLTAIHPQGRGGVAAIKAALADAQVKADQIGYINAHGTATPMNDPAETNIIKRVFAAHTDPQQQGHVVISSTKSMTGHLLGGAGGVEAALSVLALRDQIAPPTINLDSPDKQCDLDYVPHVARDIRTMYALSTSFGFGGGNAALILKK